MYLLSYFKEEAESLFLAESVDGLSWTERNGGLPILTSSIGTGQIRDPFILQDKSDRFHALWTDGWNSLSIGYATSLDLNNWEDMRLIPLMHQWPDTQNVWAPEAFYDSVHDFYRIIWSSTVKPGPRDHRIWSTTTRDFKSFTEPALFFDPGFNVIDASVVTVDGDQLLLFKDERGRNEPGTDFKAIRSCRMEITSDKVVFGPLSDLLTPPLLEGPTAYMLPEDNQLPWKWVLLADGFHEGCYAAFGSNDLASWNRLSKDIIRLPAGIRHASVLCLM
ncbi:glycoside hydrolase family 43 protein [Paenibacillus sp. FSL K6-1230]|uniref:glycoside hydrolase family 43 protein n=1 Tax=Paenibacillus sp. FSL K6-1230 TaxID=2921603 RepID=UPI0030FAF91E